MKSFNNNSIKSNQMLIKIDNREHELLQQVQQMIANIPIFNKIQVKTEALPIGDIIIADADDSGDSVPKDHIIIERKTVNDLLSSIKDGRYEEQSYRLNGINHPNHNIIYLIEGDVNRINRFKTDNRVEKLTLYSAMFSLNYYKGFSLFRTGNLEETATVICNMVYKLTKEAANKKPYYTSNDSADKEVRVVVTDEATNQDTDKDYVNVVKKVKKENITAENIDEIMLSQIPGISTTTALAIIQKYASLANLIREIEKDPTTLKDVSYTNAKGQTRKINKTVTSNIVKFLLKK
jgi:ERCC4-type nuclease